MKSTVIEELPLLRAKPTGAEYNGGTGPNVGPGSYDLEYHLPANNSRAPFNTTGVRPPLNVSDPRIPGPGNYHDFYDPPVYADYGKKGITSVPFTSATDRFRSAAADDTPGPGQYDLVGNWPTKRGKRTHAFTVPASRSLVVEDQQPASGPGYYNPNYSASYRKNPKAAHFAKYSSRDGDLSGTGPGAAKAGVPGPGSYDLDKKPRSLYDAKPSSMFATKTNRSIEYGSAVPGPGAYELDPMATKPKTSDERFSAFGSSTKRFHVDSSVGNPGPGSYTGEIAPRRQRPGYTGTAAFLSDSERFVDGRRGAPGPGSYDGRLYPKHMDFGGNTPFLSTVPRFARITPEAVPFDELFNARASHVTPLRASRTGRMRPFIQREISPTLGPEVLPPRSYNVNYDWPEGTDNPKRFGTAPRFLDVGKPDKANDNPGPGHYFRDDANKYPRGTRFDNSNWPRDVRFKSGGHPWGEPGNPGPGRYYHEATLLNKTHNATIGSDTTWLDQQNP